MHCVLYELLDLKARVLYNFFPISSTVFIVNLVCSMFAAELLNVIMVYSG